MSKINLPGPAGYAKLLNEVKARIQQAQTRAMLSVNAELVRLYWDIGRIIDGQQQPVLSAIISQSVPIH